MKKVLFLFSVLILSIGLVACGDLDSESSGGSDSAKEKENTESKKSTDKEKEDKSEPENEQKEDKDASKSNVLTKEKFEQIEDGMSYDEVVKIVGSEGNLISETGSKGDQFHTVMYEFDTDGFMSSANMMFQGDKLISKAQFGLSEDSNVEITLEQFNKLENGMSYEEVTEILGGDGEVLSETGSKGDSLHTVMYSYQGKGNIGANASLMFQGDKLQNKSQFGLK